jgi:hypothetical protein
MTSGVDCAAAERLAGAIAIGEASDGERVAYRAHVAVCEGCLSELGGEREIERVMSVTARARDEERWEPDVRATFARTRTPRRGWNVAAALAAAVVLFVGVRALERPNAVVPVRQVISAQEARALAALNTQSMPPREGRAESLVVGAATYSGAVEVSVDARGTPLRCTVTKSSGDRAVDRSLCRAVMHQRYAVPIGGSAKAH